MAKLQKNKDGRPTKYKDEYIEELINFFDVESFTIVNDRPLASKFPTMARFALNIGVHVDTLHEWKNKKDKKGKLVHKEFSEAFKKAKLYQEAYIYENGLSGVIDKTFGIWAAKVILGHKEPESKKPDSSELADALSKLADKLPT